MIYPIGEVARMAGVSTRTLRHYDDVGLLRPTATEAGGRRLYDRAALLRLQQIMLYREMDLGLDEIGALLDAPEHDILQALQRHRDELRRRGRRIRRLLQTVDRTIESVEGSATMSDEELFGGFSEEKQREYAAEARTRWDPALVDASQRAWRSYTPDQQKAVIREGEEIYRELAALMPKGPDSPEVQRKLDALHAHFNRFYDCSPEIFRGLGQMYTEDARFGDTFRRLDPGLPEFMRDAMALWADRRAPRPH